MQLDELLRRLALNDERVVSSATHGGAAGDPALDEKTRAFVRLGALLSIGGATASCRATVDVALAAGATQEDIVAVLLAVGPVVGAARVVAAAPQLALAIDYDLDEADVPSKRA